MEYESRFETPNGVGWISPDGVLVWRFREGAVDTEETACEQVQKFYEMGKDIVPAPMMIVMAGLVNQTAGARQYYSSSAMSPKTASRVALILSSPVSRVLGNIYMGLTRPEVPTRIFTSEDKAFAWLLEA